MPIDPVQSPAPFRPLEGPTALQQPKQVSGSDLFAKMLEDTVMSTNNQITRAESAAEAFAAGENDDIHGTMIATSAADIQLRTLGTVRNKVMDAFYELWRMSV